MWSNDISDVAIQARQQEDAAEATAWQATKVAKGWTNGLPPDASAIDTSDYAIGTRREAARNARVYTGSLTKAGDGTLFLTGANTWHGKTTVTAGKLSVVGSHASPIDVAGGTLGGSGTVAGASTSPAARCTPGLAPEEAAQIKDVTGRRQRANAGGNVRIGSAGRLVATVRAAPTTRKLRADGDLALGGPLVARRPGPADPGQPLTIARAGRSRARSTGCPRARSCRPGATVQGVLPGQQRDADRRRDGGRTVGGTVPATLALTLGAPAHVRRVHAGRRAGVPGVDDRERHLDRG